MSSEGGWYYVLWGLGTLLLLGVLVWAVITYRRSRAGRAQAEIERRSARWTPEK